MRVEGFLVASVVDLGLGPGDAYIKQEFISSVKLL